MQSTILIVCSLLLVSITEAAEFKCGGKSEHVSGDSGVLIIDRSQGSCEFKGQDDTQVFALRTDNIQLRSGDQLTISAVEPPKEYNFKAPLEPGYILIGLKEPAIKFQFASTDNGTMRAEFIQNKATIPINGDNYNQLRINPIAIQNVNLVTTKTIPDQIHLEVIGSGGFGHSLVNSTPTTTAASFDTSQNTIVIKSGPVLSKYSGTYQTKDEKSYDISGPDPKTVDDKYKCVNIYEITNDQGHYEVDFKDFLGLTDGDDELLLDDGVSKVKINGQQASDYAKRLVVFAGKKLAVIYNSPRKINRTNIPFKLTVRVKMTGGILAKAGKLVAPSGQTHYVLRPQAEQFASLVTKGQLKGADLKITTNNPTSQDVTLADGSYLPPVIGLNQKGSELVVDLSSKSKLSSDISFDPSSVDCHGIIYGTSGSISLSGANKICYWTLGASKNHLSIDHTNLGPGGCLEIYSLTKADPIFKRCDLSPYEVLPGFVLDQGYVKVQLAASNTTKFLASIKPALNQFNQISAFNRVNVTSARYPHSYEYFTQSDSFTINSINKTMVVSVEDLDVRSGEKLQIDNKDVNDMSSIAGDIEIFNKTSTVVLKRTTSNDFTLHRGYKVVTTEFQEIINADIKKNSITSHANLTSLLLKVVAKPGQRIQYNVTSKSAITNATLSIIDSRTILGRQVYGDERDHGSTTSNSLLISVLPLTKVGLGAQQLPVIDVQFKLIECNKTVDHICDNDTRCVAAEKLCKGRSYCDDGSDLRISCSSGPAPKPQIIDHGVGGVAVFLLCTIMFVFGVISALYGPDIFKNLEARFRSGQYTTFTSTE